MKPFYLTWYQLVTILNFLKFKFSNFSKSLPDFLLVVSWSWLSLFVTRWLLLAISPWSQLNFYFNLWLCDWVCSSSNCSLAFLILLRFFVRGCICSPVFLFAILSLCTCLVPSSIHLCKLWLCSRVAVSKSTLLLATTILFFATLEK